MNQQCFFCGHFVSLVHVHGHYQCPVCHTNALPCCDGDNCNTNVLLDEKMIQSEQCISETLYNFKSTRK